MKRLAVVGLALALTACSAPEEQHTETDPPGAEQNHEDDHAAGALEGARQIMIVAREFSFTPGTIHMEAGEPVNITLVNEGSVVHHFGIDAVDFHLDAEPGETVTGSLVIETPGEYVIGCHIEGHQEAGMIGEAHVESR